MISNPNQNGASLIAAIFIIVILGFMGVMFVSLIGTGSLTAVNDLQSAQALYVAEGGLENAVLLLNTSNLATRTSCSNVGAGLTNILLGQGRFSITVPDGPNVPFYSANVATLAAGGINPTDTTINTNAAPANYASSGRIMIDRELIDYSSISGNSFIGAVRGRDGTTAASHAAGAPVGQYQCSITSNGGIPDLAAPRAQRAVREGVQLQEGWAVGAGGTMLRWNDGTVSSNVWSNYVSPATTQLNSVYMLSYADGWAVGARRGCGAPNRQTILRWNGANWSCYAPVVSDNGLQSVFMVSSTDGWAVGGTNNTVMLRWTAGAWANYVPPVATQLNSVFMIDADNNGIAEDGWAVGIRRGCGAPNRQTILRWNGANWSCYAPGVADFGLNSVFMVSSTQQDGWAVGGADGGVILQWNGAAWANFGSPVAQQLNSVYMLDTNNDGIADDGWAVGVRRGCVNPGATILRWNGVNWACLAAAVLSALPDQTLNSVYCVDTNDCWAVGNAGVVGQRPVTLHWDGASWTLNNSGLNINRNLYGVFIIGPKQRPQAAWREVVN